jgi:hypothetical protein
MLNNEQKKIMMDHVDMLCKQIDKMNKKGDITPDELKRSGEVFDIVKDFETICAMEEYDKDPEEEMYSSMGYYGRNSRTAQPMTRMPMYSSQGRDSMGRYSSTMGYSRDGAKQTMRHDLEMKMAGARDEEERQMYMRLMDALER